MKSLQEYIDVFTPFIIDSTDLLPSRRICGVTNDSRKVKKDFLFIAIKGAASDGHDYISKAIENGATAIIHARENVTKIQGISYIRVSDAYAAYAFACECFFDFPARSFDLAGVTGTNGKTTTAYILKSMLEKSTFKCGLISTVEYVTGNDIIEGSRTTPEAWELQALFARMKNNSCRNVVMEVSSHGLDQSRTASALFKTAIFTNLTGDHLDYHNNMENYFNAKKRLFTEFMHPAGKAIINIDDPYSKKLMAFLPSEKVITLGTTPYSDCRISPKTATAAGTECGLFFAQKLIYFKSNLIGLHNMYNLVSAFLAALSMGVPYEKAVQALSAEYHVPGRLEKYRSPEGAFFFVDYAHTDDALTNVLSALKKLASRKIITIFGCGGDRDKTKRPRMGLAASELSDHLIVTSDNPRTEDPLAIIRDISKGIPSGTSFEIIPDRSEAIRKAVVMAKKDDIVLLAGKGHENYQEINGHHYDFSDSVELQKAFKHQG